MVKIGCDGSAQASPLGFQGGAKKNRKSEKKPDLFLFSVR